MKKEQFVRFVAVVLAFWIGAMIGLFVANPVVAFTLAFTIGTGIGYTGEKFIVRMNKLKYYTQPTLAYSA